MCQGSSESPAIHAVEESGSLNPPAMSEAPPPARPRPTQPPSAGVALVAEAPMGQSHVPDSERRREREERRRRRREEAEAEYRKELESSARWLYIMGFFALPLLWLISLLYFHREHRDENASPLIKSYYAKSRIMLVIYTIIFLSWFIVFQVKSDSLGSLNILNFKGSSPSGV